MKEHIIYKYEAFDGTMFNEADECRDYEMKKISENITTVLLDNEWNKVTLDYDGASRAFAVIINSPADIAFVKELFSDVGVGHPFQLVSGNCDEKVGVYVYDDSNDRWVNFDEKFGEIKDIYERCLACRH